jgi:hypothetical protein
LGVRVVFGVGGAALLVAHQLVELILSGGSHGCEGLKCLAGYWRNMLGLLVVDDCEAERMCSRQTGVCVRRRGVVRVRKKDQSVSEKEQDK